MRFISPSMALRLGCATRASCRQLAGAVALLLAAQAAALPTDFNDKLEAALMCRSEWDTGFWQGYFNKHLQTSIRDWGEARWWSSQGAQLGGAQTLEVFTNLDESRTLMVGVLIPQPVDSVRQTLEQNLAVSFKPVQTADGLRYVSDTLSVLVGTTNQQTKWYCAKWNLGNRERVKPLAP